MALTTTWTGRDALAFTAGTLSTITDCITQVEQVLHRGTLSTSTSPTSTQVQNYLIFGKQELCDEFGFTWRRKYSYAATVSGTWRYALPSDFGEGGYVLRDITNDTRLSFVEQVTFDTLYPDVAGASNDQPEYYTIKDRELWLSAPANGAYTLELEYLRTGDDSTATDISFLPEIFRSKICSYAIYKSFLLLQQYDVAGIYKSEWEQGLSKSRRADGRKKWSDFGYMAKAWYYPDNS
jgi:hypothetical protein